MKIVLRNIKKTKNVRNEKIIAPVYVSMTTSRAVL